MVVTGVPGSGKTTLARDLAPALGLPLFSLDAIKESLFETLGARDREWSLQLRQAALEILWTLLRDSPRGAIIDLWLDPRRDDGVAQAGIANVGLTCSIEVMCEVPRTVAAGRYAERRRHPGHLPPDEETLARIREAADIIAPLGLTHTLRVNTSRPVDVTQLARQLHDLLNRH